MENVSTTSSLNINYDKSKFCMSEWVKDKLHLSNCLGIPVRTFPRYLGLPLSSTYPKAVHFRPPIDSCHKRREGQSSKVLSTTGKVQLISSVLQNIANFWLQTYKLPTSIVRKIKAVFANFFWESKLHNDSWASICKPKREGGMNIRSVKEMNHASGVKLLWPLTSTNSLRAAFMNSRYMGNNEDLFQTFASMYDSAAWKFILQSRDRAMGIILSI